MEAATRSATRANTVMAPTTDQLYEGITYQPLNVAESYGQLRFFTADELSRVRPGAPDASAMGHAPISGVGGTLAALAELRGRKLYVHMNNTNPVLDAGSEAASRVARAGVEIARDGMELAV